MSAGGCLPLYERALRVERPGHHRGQKTGWQDCKWSRCWVCLAPYGLKSPFIEVSSKNQATAVWDLVLK